MHFSYYLFALFVFLLLCLFMKYYAKKIRPKEDKTESSQREQRLFMLYQNLEEMMDDMEVFMEKARTEMAEQKHETADMLEQMEQLYSKLMEHKQEIIPPAPPKKRGRPRKQQLTVVPVDGRPMLVKSKHERVRELMAQGATEESIARQLGISKGEVSLIAGMKKFT